VTDPDPILRALTSAIGKLTTGLGAVRTQLVAMEAASVTRHAEQVRMAQVAADADRAQAAAIRAALKAFGRHEEEDDPVSDARQARTVAITEMQTATIKGFGAWAGKAWARIWSPDLKPHRWVAYTAMVSALLAWAREAFADYPYLTVLLRIIEAAAAGTGATP
jgi:hypothetical protein